MAKTTVRKTGDLKDLCYDDVDTFGSFGKSFLEQLCNSFCDEGKQSKIES